MEDDKLKKFEAERKTLMFELYVMEYKKEVELTSYIESHLFMNNILNDWRFWQFYIKNFKKYGEDITIEQFFKKEIICGSEGMFKFITEVIMDLPDKEKPQKLYINEEYPFKFEIIDNINFNVPSFSDFDFETSSIMMNYMIKAVPYLTEEEVKQRMIKALTLRINLKKERLKKIKAKQKKKKIKYLYKYDEYGNVENIYKNRAEACKKEGFTKSAMSKHLNGKRQKLNGFIYKEVIKEEKD